MPIEINEVKNGLSNEFTISITKFNLKKHFNIKLPFNTDLKSMLLVGNNINCQTTVKLKNKLVKLPLIGTTTLVQRVYTRFLDTVNLKKGSDIKFYITRNSINPETNDVIISFNAFKEIKELPNDSKKA